MTMLLLPLPFVGCGPAPARHCTTPRSFGFTQLSPSSEVARQTRRQEQAFVSRLAGNLHAFCCAALVPVSGLYSRQS